jgi:hypothetical protein
MNITTRHTLIAAIVGLAAGCTTNKEPEANWQDPFFPPHHGVAPTRAIIERQYAAGAAEDGMLYAQHFDGDVLNTLGEQKLRAMIVGRPANTPLHVYLNLPGTAMNAATQPASQPADASIARRQANLERALVGLGLEPVDYVVALGGNPDAMRPADAGVRALAPVGVPNSGTAAPGGGGLPSGMPR